MSYSLTNARLLVAEQEITGDVLLELDANLLKTELGIMAFGKRVRISNAIAELRRPPSISYSDNHVDASPLAAHTPITPQSQSHSRTQSQSQSHYSFPGSGPGHNYSQSIQSSLGSPLGFTGLGNGMNGFTGHTNGNAVGNGAAQPGFLSGFAGAAVPLVESPSQDYVTVTRADGEGSNGNAVGLGISDESGLLVRFSLWNSSCAYSFFKHRNRVPPS
jgi:hypothetical protein